MDAFDNPGGVTVLVAGERWTEIKSLASAGPQDKVFVLDRTTGTVEFGDGTHGQRPEVGAEIGVSYLQGGGEAGNAQLSLTFNWPPQAQRYLIATGHHRIRIGRFDNSAER
jgi:hypothetical protein